MGFMKSFFLFVFYCIGLRGFFIQYKFYHHEMSLEPWKCAYSFGATLLITRCFLALSAFIQSYRRMRSTTSYFSTHELGLSFKRPNDWCGVSTDSRHQTEALNYWRPTAGGHPICRPMGKIKSHCKILLSIRRYLMDPTPSLFPTPDRTHFIIPSRDRISRINPPRISPLADSGYNPF